MTSLPAHDSLADISDVWLEETGDDEASCYALFDDAAYLLGILTHSQEGAWFYGPVDAVKFLGADAVRRCEDHQWECLSFDGAVPDVTGFAAAVAALPASMEDAA